MPFQYAPLDEARGEIRLLQLLRNNGDSVEFRMRTVPKEESVPYHCLSYEWGDDTLVTSITIDGSEVLITKNLDVALSQLRAEKDVHFLWVDALCINQTDLVEKTHQISRMGAIYQDAVAVLAWLGPGTEQSDLAMRAVDLFGHRIVHHMRMAFPEKGPAGASNWEELDGQTSCLEIVANIGLADSAIWEYFDYKDPRTRPDLDIILTIIRRTFWKRAWILQELAKSREAYILAGGERTPLYCFVAICEFVQATVFVSADHETALWVHDFLCLFTEAPILEKMMRVTAAGRRRDIMTLVEESVSLEVKVPQDRIFALSALTATELGPEINYTRTLPQLLEQLGRETFLRNGFYAPRLSLADCPWAAGCPSWIATRSGACPLYIPLVSALVLAADLNGVQYSPKYGDEAPRFRACGQTSLIVTQDSFPMPGVLNILCRIVDRIDMVQSLGGDEDERIWHDAFIQAVHRAELTSRSSQFYRDELSWFLPVSFALSRMMKFLVEIFNVRVSLSSAALPQSYSSNGLGRECSESERAGEGAGTASFEAMYRLLSFTKQRSSGSFEGHVDNYKKELSRAVEIRLKAAEQAAEQMSRSMDIGGIDWVTLTRDINESAGFRRILKDACWRRSVFVGKDGYIGLGPEELQVGDMVVILPGVEIPLVIGPSRSGDGTFEIIGEAFVPGVMYGELFEGSDGPPEEWINIR